MARNSCVFVSLLVLVLITTVFPLLNDNSSNVKAAAGMVIVVPDDYATVSLAVEAASDGDTIFIRSGQHPGVNILVNKTLVIVGESTQNTTIDGGGTALSIFQIVASNVTIENLTLRHTANSFGEPGTSVRIFNAENVKIRSICTEEVYHGIEMRAANFSTVMDSVISNSTANGLYVHDSSVNNTVVGNTIEDNNIGVLLASPADEFNLIYHNNFINNTSQISIFSTRVNYFDNGYPSGGNYYSDHSGTDVNYTAGQNVSGNDGIFDDGYLEDNYPLVNPFLGFHVAAEGEDFRVGVSTNVTLTSCDLNISTKMLEFQLQTFDNFTGSLRVQIPKAVLRCSALDEWGVTVWDNGSPGSPSYLLPLEDLSYTYLYFTFNNTATISRIDITGTEVLPEFNVAALVLLFGCLTGAFAFAEIIRRGSQRTVVRSGIGKLTLATEPIVKTTKRQRDGPETS